MLQSIAFGHHPFGIGNRTRRVEPFRAGVGAVHDGVAAIETERILEPVEALAGMLIPTVDQPPMRLQQDRWAEIAILVPPITRARRRTAEAKNAFPRAVELCAFLWRLTALAIRWRLIGLYPRLDQSVLRIETGEVRDEILQHLQVRQRRDAARPFLQAVHRRQTGQRVGPLELPRHTAP